jgi:thymidine kinase
MAPFTIIHGCMFAGKTKALFRHVQQSNLFPEEILLVKHATDTRYQHDYIVSHEGERRECNPVRLPLEISYLINESIKLVAIDEIQFFNAGIVNVIQELMIKDIEVVAAGLLHDYKHQPFGCMPQLLSISSQDLAITGICCVCNGKATHTYRKTDADPLILVGGPELYESRCGNCYLL